MSLPHSASWLEASAAALGLSAFLATTAWAFTAIKLIGGAYLVFLGIKMILERRKQFQVPSDFRHSNTTAAFRQGVITNVLNPKVALFFLAFLPQFIDPASPHKIAAFLALGSTFVTTGTIWCLVLAWCAGTFSERLRRNETLGQWLNRAAGSLFVFLGYFSQDQPFVAYATKGWSVAGTSQSARGLERSVRIAAAIRRRRRG